MENIGKGLKGQGRNEKVQKGMGQEVGPVFQQVQYFGGCLVPKMLKDRISTAHNSTLK